MVALCWCLRVCACTIDYPAYVGIWGAVPAFWRCARCLLGARGSSRGSRRCVSLALFCPPACIEIFQHLLALCEAYSARAARYPSLCAVPVNGTHVGGGSW